MNINDLPDDLMNLNDLPDEDTFLGADQYLQYLKENNPGKLVTKFADTVEEQINHIAHYSKLSEEIHKMGYIKKIFFIDELNVNSCYWYWSDIPDEEAYQAIIEHHPTKPHPTNPFTTKDILD